MQHHEQWGCLNMMPEIQCSRISEKRISVNILKWSALLFLFHNKGEASLFILHHSDTRQFKVLKILYQLNLFVAICSKLWTLFSVFRPLPYFSTLCSVVFSWICLLYSSPIVSFFPFCLFSPPSFLSLSLFLSLSHVCSLEPCQFELVIICFIPRGQAFKFSVIIAMCASIYVCVWEREVPCLLQ